MKRNDKKRIKQILTALLIVAVTVGFIPQMGTPVYADEGTPAAIQLITNGAAPNITGGSGGTSNGGVWFGNYKQSSDGKGGFNEDPVKWRVLQNADSKLFLLADQNLDCRKYNDEKTSVTWETSSIRAWLNGKFKDAAFSDEEVAAVADTQVGESITDKVFLLSIEEAMNTDYGFTDSFSFAVDRLATNTAYTASYRGMNESGRTDDWWLRSMSADDDSAMYVDDWGYPSWNGLPVNTGDFAVRPAFNLNLKSVLFTSAAVGGKSSYDEGPGALKEVGANTTSEWKLTLLDDGSDNAVGSDHKNFVINSAGITYDPASGTVKIPYSGAATGNNEYISAIIKDSNDNIKYYGRVAGASGKVDAAVTISTANIGDGDTLCVFNEQFNGDKTDRHGAKTDYASALAKVKIPEPISYDVTFKVVNGAWNSGTAEEKKVTLAGYEGDTLKLEPDQIPAAGSKPDKNYKAGSWDTVPSAETAITGNTTYTYTYVKDNPPVYYTVTFVDGQGKTLKTQKVQSGKAATAPAAPKRPGYTFAGWDRSFSKVTGNMTVTAKWKKNAAPKPAPKPTHESKPAPAFKVSGTLLAKMTAKGSRKLEISWNQIKGAEGYDIFFVKCSRKNTCRLVRTVKGNETLKWTKKGLKKKKSYKAYVKAYVMKNGRKTYVKSSPTVHAYTSGYTKRYTNPKKVTVKQSSVSLNKGKTYQIKAKVKKLKKNRKLMPSGHEPKLRYLSSNGRIAMVSRSGQILAKAKGSCTVYVIAVNGAKKAVKVTVR